MLVSNPTIHFFTYERLRISMSKIAAKRGTPITSLEFFCMGAMAKAVATVVVVVVVVVVSWLYIGRMEVVVVVMVVVVMVVS